MSDPGFPSLSDSQLPLFAGQASPSPLRAPGPGPGEGDADLLRDLIGTGDATDTVLARFGSFGALLDASPAQLTAAGLTVEARNRVGLVRAAAARLCRGRLLNRPLLTNWAALLDYCQVEMGALRAEQLRLLLLDRKNRLIADQVLATGSIDHVPIYPREVLRRALDHDASALIVVHNHPSGDPHPSDSDIDMTRQLQSACSVFGIVLHDHLVIGAGRHFSFRSGGLL